MAQHRENTNLYVSLTKDEDSLIDTIRINMVKNNKRHYTKTETAKELIMLGIDVLNGKYLKLDPEIDTFVSKLQDMVIEMNGNKITLKKSKEQVYHMIIEKGLQHLSDD